MNRYSASSKHFCMGGRGDRQWGESRERGGCEGTERPMAGLVTVEKGRSFPKGPWGKRNGGFVRADSVGQLVLPTHVGTFGMAARARRTQR